AAVLAGEARRPPGAALARGPEQALRRVPPTVQALRAQELRAAQAAVVPPLPAAGAEPPAIGLPAPARLRRSSADGPLPRYRRMRRDRLSSVSPGWTV